MAVGNTPYDIQAKSGPRARRNAGKINQPANALAALGSPGANLILAGPTSGTHASPHFRGLITADLNSLFSTGNQILYSTAAGVAAILAAPTVGQVLQANASGNLGWTTVLINGAADSVIDLDNYLMTINGSTTVDWNNCQLVGNPALVTNAIMLDWSVGILYTAGGNKIFDWNHGSIYDGAATPKLVLSCNGRQCYDVNNKISIDWGGRIMNDASAVAAVDYGNRTLKSSGTVIALDWSGGAVLVRKLTTTEKNALTAVDGMIVYDTTLAKFQGREAGAWVNLI